MIVTDTVKAQGGLDLLIVAMDDQAIDYMRDELRHMVVFECENIGAFMSAESVVFFQREDNARHQQIVTAYWCPDSRKGVEFRGGPNDGKILPVGSAHERPPEYYNLMPEYSPPSLSRDEGPVPHPAQIGTYKLTGIDSEHDRWVYTFAR